MNLKFPIFVAAAICAQTAGATTFAVPAGGNLQSVLDNVQSGDTVTLQAGATYVGHFRLKANPGNQTITIQSSNMGALPPGKRVSANDADAMPKLITPDGNAALWMTTGANYYRIQGIEFRPANGVYAQDVIQVGVGSETSVDQLPHDIDFDRVYVHGDPSAGSKRGIALNGGNTTVENSYFSAFTSTWQDTQALCGWNGPGPYKIINNYLEAGTETVAFGGAVPAIYGVVPSDILVQNNNFFKPLSWKPGDPSYAGVPVLVKNHLELKSGQRVTIDGNVLENNWIGADQRGSAFVFTVRTEVNRVPWAVVNDITITNNIIRHSPAGMLVAGHDDNPAGSGSSGRFMVRNNIWQDISSSVGGDGRLFTVLSGVQGITFDHNTAFQSGWIMVFDGGTSYNVNYTNNITAAGWGVAGNGTGVGIPTLNAYAGGGTFSRNVLIGASPNQYPSDNFFPSNVDQVGFTNYGAGNFLLSSGSSYRGAGTDSKDLGSSLVTAAGSANNSGVPTGWVNIVSKNSGKCMDVIYQSTAPGANLIQYDCWGGDNQKFLFTPVSGGYKVTAKHSGLQLDVWGGTEDGPPIAQWTYWGGPNEIFQLNPTSDGYYSINPVSSGKCFDVAAISRDNGAPVIQWTCWGGDNQKWRFVPVQ